MGRPLTSTVGQFSIVDGTVQEDAPNLMVTRGPSGSRVEEAGQLFIAVELVGHSLGEEEIYNELLQAISDAYYRHPGSVTARLQEAIQEANALLAHANSGLMQRDWLVGGVTCVLHSDRDVYIGQAGPSVLHLAQKGDLKRFPDESPWFQQPLPTSPDRIYPLPLGIHANVHPNLFHATVQPGDVIVLSTTSLAVAFTPRQVQEAVVYQPIEEALYNLARLCGDNDVACMVIQVHPKGKPVQVLETAAAPEEEEPEPLPVEFEASELDELEEEILGADFVEEEEAGAWLAEEPSLRSPEEADARLYQVRRRKAPREGSAGGFSILEFGRKVGQAFRSLLSDIGLGFAVMGGWIAGLFRRAPKWVGTAPAERPTRPAKPTATRRIGTALVVLVPLAAIIAAAVLYLQSDARNQKFQDLLAQSQAKIAQAQSAPTASEKHALLHEALGLVDEAHALNSKDASASQLRAQIQVTLDQVDGTLRLGDPIALYQAGAGEATRFKRLAAAGLEFYLLDAGGQRAMRAALAEGGAALASGQALPVLVEKGAAMQDYAVTGLLDMVWAPTGGSRMQSGLLLLTDDNRLLEYSARRGIGLLKVGNTERWARPTAIATYLGKLYVLDTATNQIFRYSPDAEGYSGAPEEWFALSQPRDLRGAVDMAIDGAIYVAYSDGRVEKFMTGDPQPFPMEGLAEPLRQPAAIYTDVNEEVRHVYVADPAAARVVQFTKEGQFVRQYRFSQGDWFSGISDLYVNEAENRLYFVSDGGLYVSALPSL